MEKTLNPTDSQEQFAENIRNATQAAEGAIEQGGEMLEQQAAQLQETAAAATQAIQSALNTVGEQITVGAKAADRMIREKPYQATAIALGVGLLVGYLIKRK